MVPTSTPWVGSSNRQTRGSDSSQRAKATAPAPFSTSNSSTANPGHVPRVRKTFEEGGMDLFPPDQQTPEAASALLKSELKLWGDVIRANNISAQ